MLSTTNTKDYSAEQLIELIKQLPKEKQEFVNGYVQGVADACRSEKSA